ncbi:MAG: energy transducer TonB [Rhodospirillales bacterium]|nr:energy transducer TonB [Rhodospirillales bacterium]
MLIARKTPDAPKPGKPGFGPRVLLASALCHAAVFSLAWLAPAAPTPVLDVPMVVELVFEDDVPGASAVTPEPIHKSVEVREETAREAAVENAQDLARQPDDALAVPPVPAPAPDIEETAFDDLLPQSDLGTLRVRRKPKPPIPEKTAAEQLPVQPIASQVEPRPVERIASLDVPPLKHARQIPNRGQAGVGRFGAVAMAGNPQPVYPRRAVRQSIEGTVHLSVVVAASGRPARIDVAQTSGHDILDRVAVETVYRWRFRPAMSGGLPVEGRVNLPIVFRLIR